MKRIILAVALLSAVTLHAKPVVMLGIDVLEQEKYVLLKGKRVGLITNHTGVNSRGKSTIDLLRSARDVRLTTLFSPEHGIRGKAGHGEIIKDGRDTKSGLPVYSLYGATKRPTDEMLRNLDALVFDIQDIGARFYTYSTTLAYALEEAAKHNLELIVLDRPNPITGALVEGETLSADIKHFTAYLQVPVRHGMTMGELANWYNRTSGLNAKLTVVKMKGWRRNMWWDETKLKFRPTSPNMRNLRAAALYPGIGALECTNISVGRGTNQPLEIIGAPWIDGDALAERLEFHIVAGYSFVGIKFTPKSDIYKGEICGGVKILITDRNEGKSVDLFYFVFHVLRDLYPDQFKPRWDEVERVTGSKKTRELLEKNESVEQILFLVYEGAAKFRESRAPYLLYE